MDTDEIEEMLTLTIKEGLRRVKDDPQKIADHVLDKWIASLSRIWERLQDENRPDQEAEPDVLDSVTSLPKTRAKAVLREERNRLNTRLVQVNQLLEEYK
jgi:hypothetical protein